MRVPEEGTQVRRYNCRKGGTILPSQSLAWHPRTSDPKFWSIATTTTFRSPMAHPRSFVAPLSRITAPTIASARPSLLRFVSAPLQQASKRCAATKSNNDGKKKKARKHFIQYDLKKADQFSLIDAMQYVSSLAYSPVGKQD